MPQPDSLQKIDRSLHQRAAKKLAQGLPLKTDERAAYKRVEKLLEAERRQNVLTNLPIGEYCRYAKRRINVVREQGERYGLPVSDKTVSVPDLIEWLHDFLRDNCWKLKGAEAIDDPLLEGDPSDGLEEYRRESAKVKKLQRLQLERTLVPRQEIREVLDRTASTLSRLIEDLERKFGPDAADLAESALSGLEREIQSSFGDRDAA